MKLQDEEKLFESVYGNKTPESGSLSSVIKKMCFYYFQKGIYEATDVLMNCENCQCKNDRKGLQCKSCKDLSQWGG